MRPAKPGEQKPGARIYKARPTPGRQQPPAAAPGATAAPAGGQAPTHSPAAPPNHPAAAGQSAAAIQPGTPAMGRPNGVVQGGQIAMAPPAAARAGAAPADSAAQTPPPGTADAPPKADTPYRANGAPAGQYPHRTANAAKPNPFVAFFRDKKKLGITIAALAVVLVALVVVVLALPRQAKPPVSGTPGVAPGSSNSAPSASVEDYDKDANSLPQTAFIGTILPESEDAGVAYIEETLFLGDSNTVRMMSYRDITHVTLDNCIGVESMGITQFSTLKCARFVGLSGTYTMPEAMAIMKPRRVVITFGTNNVGMGTSTFIDFYLAAIEAARQAYEYADIIIGAVPPLDRMHQGTALSMTSVDQFNLALVELAEEMDCKFLNWSEVLKDPATGYCTDSYTLSDGVHITREGMEAMFGYFRTHAWLTEDRRPKPLGTIPQQNGSMHDIITNDPTKSRPTSSSSAAAIEVVFSAGKGGTLSGGGTVQLAPGKTSGAVTAIPNDGYEFAYWSVSLGSIPDPYSPTISGFTVPGNATAGTVITITASFTAVETSSSSEPPIVPSSSETSTPSVPEPPSSTPPDPASNAEPPVDSTPSVPQPPVDSTPAEPDPPSSIVPETPVDSVPVAEDPAATPDPQPAGEDPAAQPGEDTQP